MCACTTARVHAHVRVYAWVHMCMHECKHARMHVHAHMFYGQLWRPDIGIIESFSHLCVCACACTGACLYMSAYVHAWMQTCMCTHKCFMINYDIPTQAPLKVSDICQCYTFSCLYVPFLCPLTTLPYTSPSVRLSIRLSPSVTIHVLCHSLQGLQNLEHQLTLQDESSIQICASHLSMCQFFQPKLPLPTNLIVPMRPSW